MPTIRSFLDRRRPRRTGSRRRGLAWPASRATSPPTPLGARSHPTQPFEIRTSRRAAALTVRRRTRAHLSVSRLLVRSSPQRLFDPLSGLECSAVGWPLVGYDVMVRQSLTRMPRPRWAVTSSVGSRYATACRTSATSPVHFPRVHRITRRGQTVVVIARRRLLLLGSSLSAATIGQTWLGWSPPCLAAAEVELPFDAAMPAPISS